MLKHASLLSPVTTETVLFPDTNLCPSYINFIQYHAAVKNDLLTRCWLWEADLQEICANPCWSRIKSPAEDFSVLLRTGRRWQGSGGDGPPKAEVVEVDFKPDSVKQRRRPRNMNLWWVWQMAENPCAMSFIAIHTRKT